MEGSERPPEATPATEPESGLQSSRRELPAAVRWVALALFVLLLLIIVNVAGNVRARQAQDAAFGQGVDGLAGMMVDPLLQAQIRAGRGLPTGLQPVVDSIARQGRYVEVTITDARGRVLASTDSTLAGRTLESMATAPNPTRVTRPADRIMGERGVFQPADRRLGSIRVVAGP